jgi:hypothetical protein
MIICVLVSYITQRKESFQLLIVKQHLRQTAHFVYEFLMLKNKLDFLISMFYWMLLKWRYMWYRF